MSNTKSASTRLRENTNAKHAIGKTTSPSHQPSSTHSSALFASHLLPSISTRESTTQEQGLTSKRPRTKTPERHKQKDKNVSMTPSGQFAAGIRNVTHSPLAHPARPTFLSSSFRALLSQFAVLFPSLFSSFLFSFYSLVSCLYVKKHWRKRRKRRSNSEQRRKRC